MEGKPAKKRVPTLIELEYPIEWDGKLIDKIMLHRPKGKHIKGMKSDATMEDMLLIAAKLIEIPDDKSGMGVATAMISELDGADCIAISELLGTFLESGQRTGKL